MNNKGIVEKLFSMQDTKYRDFQSKLFPTVDRESVIGVRTPQLRKFAKELLKEKGYQDFLDSLPHGYFDENQLHAFIISGISNFDICVRELEKFLPYVDNWATCDQMSPKVFKKHREELLEHIEKWINSDEIYTVRYAVDMLLEHYLDDAFEPRFLDMAASLNSEEYYIRMAVAWYFATALAKQWDSTFPYIEGNKLDAWTHNKTIQKAVESYRITPQQKEILRSYKIKQNKKSQ
ncbi:MAG: DNA alkylation repair protein [Butyrivibrio sp.]|nr:DNA alkylation repair protein [Butyrivibrio sp.]